MRAVDIATIDGEADAPVEFIEAGLSTVGRLCELTEDAASGVMSSESLMPLLMSDLEAVVSATLMLLLRIRNGSKVRFSCLL